MGVVRREGEWRLEKQDDGFYEVTYQSKSQAEVITPAYDPGMFDNRGVALIPVHEVDSYTEAEGIFEEYAHGGPPTGMGSLGVGGSPPTRTASGNDLGLDFSEGDGEVLEDLENVPPGGVAVALLLVAGLLLSISGFAPGEPLFLMGVAMGGVGVLIIAWAGFLYRTEGWRDAVEFLVTIDEDEPSTTEASGKSSDAAEPTPPASESLKRELIFGRAEQTCEWCSAGPLDNPEVHHITPRNEGGPNDSKNLIVLCPTCHRKADRGGISRTKLGVNCSTCSASRTKGGLLEIQVWEQASFPTSSRSWPGMIDARWGS